MSSRSGPSFVHQQQKDGSWRSICPACEQTIVADDRERSLAWMESFHFCESDRLHELTTRPDTIPIFPSRLPHGLI